MHSVSPAMHNAAFAAAGLDAVYVPLQRRRLRRLPGVRRRARRRGRQRHDSVQARRAARGRVDADDADARRSAPSTRCARRDGAGWEATNTDVAGFLAPLEARIGRPLRGRARRGARRRRLGARRRRRRWRRAARGSPCTRGAPSRRSEVAASLGARRRRVAAGAGLVGSAGQLHAARRRRVARRVAAAGRAVRRAVWSTT